MSNNIVEADVLDPNKSYEARGIISAMDPVGYYQEGLLRSPIYRYLTLDCGKGKPSIAVEFVREARWIARGAERYLDLKDVKEGEILVSPGFVYKKIPWTSQITAAHLKALPK